MDGTIDYGVLPIENSSTGGITDVYDLISKIPCLYCRRKGIVKVEHCLLVYDDTRRGKIYGGSIPIHRGCPSVMPSSVPILFCGPFPVAIRRRLPVWWQSGRSVPCCRGWHQAAETYGLSVLMRGIQTNQSNYTRFVIIGKKRKSALRQTR